MPKQLQYTPHEAGQSSHSRSTGRLRRPLGRPLLLAGIAALLVGAVATPLSAQQAIYSPNQTVAHETVTHIGRITGYPNAYQGQHVTLQAQVTDTYGPAGGYQLVILDDPSTSYPEQLAALVPEQSAQGPNGRSANLQPGDFVELNGTVGMVDVNFIQQAVQAGLLNRSDAITAVIVGQPVVFVSSINATQAGYTTGRFGANTQLGPNRSNAPSFQGNQTPGSAQNALPPSVASQLPLPYQGPQNYPNSIQSTQNPYQSLNGQQSSTAQAYQNNQGYQGSQSSQSGQSGQLSASRASSQVSIQSLSQNPGQYAGQRITVQGTVSTIAGSNAVILDNQVLVVSDQPLDQLLRPAPGSGTLSSQPLSPLFQGDQLTVTGTVIPASQQAFRQRGITVRDSLFNSSGALGNWNGRPAIVASSIQVTPTSLQGQSSSNGNQSGQNFQNGYNQFGSSSNQYGQNGNSQFGSSDSQNNDLSKNSTNAYGSNPNDKVGSINDRPLPRQHSRGRSSLRGHQPPQFER